MVPLPVSILVVALLPGALLSVELGDPVVRIGNRARFRGTRSTLDVVGDYEIHIPKIEKNLNKNNPKGLSIKISEFILHLELNEEMKHPIFNSHFFNQDEEVSQHDRGHNNCFYHGRVEGHSDWVAAMSACYGLQGSFGNATSTYHVEPLDGKVATLNQPHALYLDRGHLKESKPYETYRQDLLLAAQHDYTKTEVSTRLQRRNTNGFYFLELAIINDEALYNSLGQNLSAVLERTLAIVKHMDLIFRPLNIRVVLVSVETWSDGNRIAYPSDGSANLLLEALSEYPPKVSVRHDSLLLMTGLDLKGETLGTAFNGMMCDNRKSVGLIQDRLSAVEEVGSYAAHELGHILNMAHDDNRECSCPSPTGVCIMAGTPYRPPPSHWSSCSVADMQSGFRYKNLNRCLRNEPSVAAVDPICGNGIWEIGEVCDCGSLEECTDPCCNASTCNLTEHAQCYHGPCCSESCQFLPPSSECRVASGECDIVEHCSGKSPDCPQDMHKQDGTACGKHNFCFNGACQSLDHNCHRFFRTQSSVKECYMRFNTMGSSHGNCGSHNGGFIPCAPEHAQCGQLMFNGGTFQDREVSVTVIVASRSTAVGTEFEACTSFSSSYTLEGVNPGLVPDGIKCGNNSICVSQECIPIKSLEHITPCPLGQNGETCSGRGFCNNLNQCSCNWGYSGSSCSNNNGGDESSESTPSKESQFVEGNQRNVVISALSASVVFIGTVIVVISIFYFGIRKSRKK